jgi:hypothetical protein
MTPETPETPKNRTERLIKALRKAGEGLTKEQLKIIEDSLSNLDSNYLDYSYY